MENIHETVNQGDVFWSPSRTISEADIMNFAGLTGDLNELHTSESFAKDTKYGTRIAHGMLTLAVANGLYFRMGLFRTTVVMGVTDIKFTAPVYIGDTIRLKTTIAEKRLSSDGKKIIYGMDYEVFNQNDVLVLTGRFTRMQPL